jgi:hypothetical protein
MGYAMATTTGRSIGVLPLYHLFNGRGILKIIPSYFIPDFEQIKALVKKSLP